MIKELPNNCCAVKIPEDAINIELHEDKPGKPYITYDTGMGTDDYDILRETLPPGSYTLLFCTKEKVTEEQAREVVEMFVIRGAREIKIGDYTDSFVWRRYTNKTRSYIPYCNTGIDSFNSLLRSLDMTGNWAILKQVNK